MKNIKYKLLFAFILLIFNPITRAEVVYKHAAVNNYSLTDFNNNTSFENLKCEKLSKIKLDKKAISKKSPQKLNKGKFYRLPLFISSLGLILIGALLIFLAFNTIGYLGFIIGVIGIIMMIVWLIFYEGEKIIQ